MKRWLKYLLATVGVVALITAGYVLLKTSYQGNDEIILLNSGKAYTSFADIIGQPQFKNKIVYVDVWGTTCGPCLEEFKSYTPQLTQRYKGVKDVAFLYICIDRHPLPEVRWKDKIKAFSPKGYHILAEGDEEPRLARDIFGTAVSGQYFAYTPCYFIVDKKGRIVNKPTPNMETMELEPNDTTLLYHRLDSLRQI